MVQDGTKQTGVDFQYNATQAQNGSMKREVETEQKG
jgi:hypothetical protein